MILANGLYGNPGGRTNKPRAIPLPTGAQRRTVALWAGRTLTGFTQAELETALLKVSAHPDAHSAGYSQAKATRERIAAELATR
jgi:hypothetical protein